MPKQAPPLYIFVHLPKTAGSSLAKHIEHTISKENRLLITPELLGLDDHEPKNIKKALKNYIQDNAGEFAKKDTSLQLIHGHMITADIKKLLAPHLPTKRKWFFFTFLREPAKRVVSLYNYYSGWYWSDTPLEREKPLYKKLLLVDGSYPDFKTWYERKFKDTTQYHAVTTNVEFFARLGFLPSKNPTLKDMKQALKFFNFIGFVKTFSADSAYLYKQWGVSKFFINQNISKKFFKLKQHPEMHEYLKKDLSRAYTFYNLAQEKRAKFIENHPEYQRIHEEIKSKQRITPITQLLYDWPNNARLFSSFLRKKVPLYSRFKDTVDKVFKRNK